jgi:enoyl-[acyl-carrier-protein] reductase (NADH)
MIKEAALAAFANGRPVAQVRKCTIAPDEIARAAIFLATDASSAITGTHLKIDAGRP